MKRAESVIKEDFIVITGASKGIGESIASYLATHRNEKIVGLSRTFDKTIHPKVLPIAIDLTNDEDVFSLQFPHESGRLRAIVLNAGMFVPEKIMESGEKAIQTQFQLNVFSLVSVLQKFQPYFEESFTQIVVIASSASYSGIADAGMYAASKHAALGLARSLRLELKTQKIKVTAIAPGSTWSSSWEGSGVDPNTLIDPQDIAKLIDSLLNMSYRTNVDEIIVNPL